MTRVGRTVVISVSHREPPTGGGNGDVGNVAQPPGFPMGDLDTAPLCIEEWLSALTPWVTSTTPEVCNPF